MITRRAFCLSLFPGLLSSFGLVRAEDSQLRALVIGAADYAKHPSARLNGPPNDVNRILEILMQHGASDISILADRVPGARSPTRANMLREFDLLANRVNRNDVVFLYLSGHGGQQPAFGQELGREPDGLDEIFLATDAGRWRDAENRVENSILDDEVGALIARLRLRGAFVWAVFDICHATGANRAQPLPPGASSRKISLEMLGVPTAIARRLRVRSGRLTPRYVSCDGKDAKDAEAGGLLCFFASRSDQITIELPLPVERTTSPRMGLFTYAFVTGLEAAAQSGKPVTYRGLIESIQSVHGKFTSEWSLEITPQFCVDASPNILGRRIFT